MGHLILMTLLTPTVCLKTPYPYTSDWVELYAITLNVFPSLGLVALPPCPTYITTAESHLLTPGGDYFGES
jgi:hypothetical protein